VKFVTSLELTKTCYKKLQKEAPTFWPHMRDGGQQNIKNTKTLMFGIVEGTNKRGRPCRRWTGDIASCGVRLD